MPLMFVSAHNRDFFFYGFNATMNRLVLAGQRGCDVRKPLCTASCSISLIILFPGIHTRLLCQRSSRPLLSCQNRGIRVISDSGQRVGGRPGIRQVL